MKVFAVFFDVQYEGYTLEGIFSTREKAREQIELCKKNNKYSIDDWNPKLKDDQGNDLEDTWERWDLTITITELTIDKLAYEHSKS